MSENESPTNQPNSQRVNRVHDTYLDGGRRIPADDHQWVKALAEARSIADQLRSSYSPTFLPTTPGVSTKIPHKVVDGYCVALPFHLVLNLEATWAWLDWMAHEIEEAVSEVRDEVFQRKIMQTIAHLKRELEARARRSHLTVVP